MPTDALASVTPIAASGAELTHWQELLALRRCQGPPVSTTKRRVQTHSGYSRPPRRQGAAGATQTCGKVAAAKRCLLPRLVHLGRLGAPLQWVALFALRAAGEQAAWMNGLE